MNAMILFRFSLVDKQRKLSSKFQWPKFAKCHGRQQKQRNWTTAQWKSPLYGSAEVIKVNAFEIKTFSRSLFPFLPIVCTLLMRKTAGFFILLGNGGKERSSSKCISPIRNGHVVALSKGGHGEYNSSRWKHKEKKYIFLYPNPMCLAHNHR